MGVVVPSMSSRMARTSAGTGSTPMAAAARGAHRGRAAAAGRAAPAVPAHGAPAPPRPAAAGTGFLGNALPPTAGGPAQPRCPPVPVLCAAAAVPAQSSGTCPARPGPAGAMAAAGRLLQPRREPPGALRRDGGRPALIGCRRGYIREAQAVPGSLPPPFSAGRRSPLSPPLARAAPPPSPRHGGLDRDERRPGGVRRGLQDQREQEPAGRRENVHRGPQLGHQQEGPDGVSLAVWRGCGLHNQNRPGHWKVEGVWVRALQGCCQRGEGVGTEGTQTGWEVNRS
ncbi:hypothetical protein Nmel_006778 [Mimus melanotis]